MLYSQPRINKRTKGVEMASETLAPIQRSPRWFRYPQIAIPRANAGQSKRERKAQRRPSHESPTMMTVSKKPKHIERNGTERPIQKSLD